MFPPIFQTLKASAEVKSFVGTNPPRIFRHGNVPQDTTKPYLAWTLVSDIPQINLSDLPGMDWDQVQVDCYHPTDSGIELLAKAVRDALEQVTHVTAVLLDGRDPETKLYRTSLQADFWIDH